MCKPIDADNATGQQFCYLMLTAKTVALRGNKPNRPHGQVVFDDGNSLLISTKERCIFRLGIDEQQ
jgi:hypothetical protein